MWPLTFLVSCTLGRPINSRTWRARVEDVSLRPLLRPALPWYARPRLAGRPAYSAQLGSALCTALLPLRLFFLFLLSLPLSAPSRSLLPRARFLRPLHLALRRTLRSLAPTLPSRTGAVSSDVRFPRETLEMCAAVSPRALRRGRPFPTGDRAATPPPAPCGAHERFGMRRRTCASGRHVLGPDPFGGGDEKNGASSSRSLSPAYAFAAYGIRL